MLIVCLKITPKKARNSRMMLFFELQVVVAVVGFKWHRRGKAKNADWRNRNAFKSLPRRNVLISIFNGGGSYFPILRKFWFCHATLIA